jgi:glycosyltransferase involved in cell wall biosynthesis
MTGQRPLRVLLVTKGLDLGGIERVVVDLALGYSKRGLGVDVAVVNSARDRLVPLLIDAGITVHRLDGTDLIGFGATRRLVRLIRAGRFDVVHVHGPLPAVVARLAAVGKPAMVLTTSHTPWSSLRRSTRLGWLVTSRLDAATVAVSSAVAASLPRRPASRAVVIPHGVDPARIETARAEAARAAADRCQLEVDAAPVVLVSVASHRDAKNYPNLLHGLRRALDGGADVRLVAVGDGAGLATHVELARSLGLDSSVSFLPSSDEVLAVVAAADLLVVASDHEGQPIVVAEALALGVPVVATEVGRVPEMVDVSVGRVVPPRDPDALGAAICELANDPTLRAHLSANTNGLAVRTLDAVIDAHLALYSAVLAVSPESSLMDKSGEGSRSATSSTG